MKKILSLISTVVLATLMLAACAPANVPDAEIGSKPWHAYRTFKSEQCVYDVTRYIGDGSEAVSTKGKLTYTLTKISDAEFSLEMDFTIAYGTSELLEENYIGKTDTIKSEARFDQNMRAVSTQKRADIQSDPSLNYSYEADYINTDEDGKLTATYTDYSGAEKTLKFDKGYYFDNDYLYYYVRTLKKLENSPSSFSENINVVNWYDSFNAGKLVVYPLIVSCANKSENVTIENETIFGDFVEPGNENQGYKDEENKCISCYDVSIILNGIKTGSILSVDFSKCNYNCHTANDEEAKYARLIPLKYTTRETIPNYTTHFTEYILSDYSINL